MQIAARAGTPSARINQRRQGGRERRSKPSSSNQGAKPNPVMMVISGCASANAPNSKAAATPSAA